MSKQVLSPGGEIRIFVRFHGLWGCREGPGFSSGMSASGGAASCLPSWDHVPPLVTEGSNTQAQPESSCGDKAAHLSLQGPGEEEEEKENPHRSQQLRFTACHRAKRCS